MSSPAENTRGRKISNQSINPIGLGTALFPFSFRSSSESAAERKRTPSPSRPSRTKRSANSPIESEDSRSASRPRTSPPDHIMEVSQTTVGDHADDISDIVIDSQRSPKGRSSGETTPKAASNSLPPSMVSQSSQCMDSHAPSTISHISDSQSTPSNMEEEEVVTRIPSEEEVFQNSQSYISTHIPGQGILRRSTGAAHRFLKDSDRDSAPLATTLRFFKDLGNEIASEVDNGSFLLEPPGFPSFKKELSQILLKLNDTLLNKPSGIDMPFSRDSLSPTPPPAQASLNSIALAVARLNKRFDDLEKKTTSDFSWANSSFASAHNPANNVPSAPFASLADPFVSTHGPTRVSTRAHSRTSSPDAPRRAFSATTSCAGSPPPNPYAVTSLQIAQEKAIKSCPYPPQTGWADGTKSFFNTNTYANMVKQHAPQPAKQGPAKKNGPTPTTKPKFDNLRLVVHLKNEASSHDPAKRLPEATITNIINQTIASKCPAGSPKLIATKWNTTGNLILMLPSSTNPATIHLCYEAIRTALKVDQNTLITNDVPWSKIMLTHVPTFKASGNVPSDEEVATSFFSSNEWASSLIVTQKPRWLIKPTFLNKEHSSVVLSFQDPDGSVSRDFLKKTILLNGAVVRSKRWVDKPVLKECTKCLALNHDARSCRRKNHCDICGGAHETINHRLSCQQCKREKLADSQPCPHKLKCVNCHGEHRASDPSCPKRADYRKTGFTIRGGDQIQPSETAEVAMDEQ